MRIPAKSPFAKRAHELVTSLQSRFVKGLEAVSRDNGADIPFEPIEWERDEGRHGGGVRYVAVETPVFNRAAVNVSEVHYDDMPEKRLSSANAISTIIHPRNPRAPSVHMHFSFTEMRDGKGYWRMMADLNPSLPNDDDKARFIDALKTSAGERYDEGSAQGDRYFNIPVLGRTRGVTHFYLEGYSSGDFDADYALTKTIGEAAIDGYVEILRDALAEKYEPTDDDRQKQLAYHSLYLFQVLTLDRGTTSGLMIHNQNDVGIMGSIPAFVDRDLLSSWVEKMPKPQDKLLQGIVDALAPENPSHVTEDIRAKLAEVVRQHYKAHPEALDMQATGNIVPPTVDNHK